MASEIVDECRSRLDSSRRMNLEIQASLVRVGDKGASFLGSREWIGAVELGMVLQEELGVEYKIIHVSSGSEVVKKANELVAHFRTEGTPVMVGGGSLAYTLLGLEWMPQSGEATCLVLDPHYAGVDDVSKILKDKWVAWKPFGGKAAGGGQLFRKDSFYNLLCPLRPRVV